MQQRVHALYRCLEPPDAHPSFSGQTAFQQPLDLKEIARGKRLCFQVHIFPTNASIDNNALLIVSSL